MKLHVEVTAEDIANGVRKDCRSCPIARALWRCPGVAAPIVGDVWTSVIVGGEDLSASMPHEAESFVLAFDKSEPVEPFAFYLEFGS